MAESDDDEDDVHAGLALPSVGDGGGAASEEEEDDEDDASPAQCKPADRQQQQEEEVVGVGGSGATLPGAEDAFLVDGSAYELDPFRVAGPAAPRGEATTSRADPVRLGKPCSKLFVGGLPAELDDAALLKAFSRYGKVQEASVVRGEGGKSRGFGFVTYVHLKGASYCIQQLGNPPELTISGHTCRVRYSERRGDSQPQLNMPARGQYNPNPRRGAIEQKAPGAPGSARQLADGRADPVGCVALR